jgi:NAD(P)-dependent dehydrogenase (short-subunit alcohol dehydrogenase family)
VVNVASMGGLLPMPQSPVYAATKAGVVNFTRSLRDFGRSHGIRVNAVWCVASPPSISARCVANESARDWN